MCKSLIAMTLLTFTLHSHVMVKSLGLIKHVAKNMYGEVEIKTHSFSTSALRMSGQLQAPSASPGKRAHGPH
jgi:hypothetical protein